MSTAPFRTGRQEVLLLEPDRLRVFPVRQVDGAAYSVNQCELLEFAKRLELRPEWIQYPGIWKEHFDVTMTVRRKAVALGAVEVTMRDGVMASRKRWEERNDCPDRLMS